MLDNLKATDFNPKIEFKMLSFLDLSSATKLTYKVNRKIFEGKKTPKAIGEFIFYCSFTVYQKLKNEKLSLDLFKECAYVYGAVFNENKINNFLLWYESISALHLYLRIAKTLKYIVKERTFSDKSTEMAILITNSFLYKAHHLVIIYKCPNIIYLVGAIKNGISDESLLKCLDIFSELPPQLNNKYELVDKNTIILLLKANKEKIYSLGIKKLWLFGSFVNEEQNEYSDVDLYALTTEDAIDSKEEILVELKKIVKRPVDFHMNDDKTHFNENILKEMELILDADK
ncbi:MAG: nucleotidyltransferase domain-containing protein [Bacillales bacterium]|nr:nucleotidyltransferase domain-containing protein [Bacillales bacterium]